jgi:hypothetical protein
MGQKFVVEKNKIHCFNYETRKKHFPALCEYITDHGLNVLLYNIYRERGMISYLRQGKVSIF